MKSFLWTFFLLTFLFGTGYLIWWKTPVKKAFSEWGWIPGTAETGAVDDDNHDPDKNGSQTPPPKNGASTDPPAKTTGPAALSDAELARRIPMTEIKSFTQYVERDWANWTRVPPKLFPKSVKLKKTVQIKLPAGSASRDKGSEVFPVRLQGRTLTVAISPGGNITGLVDVDDTTFKEDIKARYDRGVEKIRSRIMRRREAAKTGTVALSAVKNFTRADIENLGPAPAQRDDGVVPLMIESIRGGEVKEISADKILRWTPVVRNQVGKIKCWTATVVYNRRSMFGTIESEAMALMRNGRLMKWVYAGTEEEID